MTTRTELTPELIFEPDGHLTDLAVTCVADGEIDLVPRAALDHLDACEPCGRKLGEAALLSASASEALREDATLEAKAEPVSIAPVSPRRARRPVPVAAIAAALLVAAITAGPALMDAATSVPAWMLEAVGWIPTLLRVARTLLASEGSALGPWSLVMKVISAVMFVVLGLQVARVTTSRRAAKVEGGVR